MSRYFNLALIASTTSNKVILTVTECNASGVTSRAYSYNEYHEPAIEYRKGATAAADAFFVRGVDGSKSIALSADSVINYNGAPHAASDTFTLAAIIRSDKSAM